MERLQLEGPRVTKAKQDKTRWRKLHARPKESSSTWNENQKANEGLADLESGGYAQRGMHGGGLCSSQRTPLKLKTKQNPNLAD